MQKYKLANGATVLFEKNNSQSVVVEITFKVGSNHESKSILGISHFIEHMLFEGTLKRKNSKEIANEIERYGAEFNAYTSADRTSYYIRIINKRFEQAVELLADMILNSQFNPKYIEKEKSVVLKEINMVTDDSKQHSWILFMKTLFERHPARNATYGSKKTVQNLNRKKLLEYYRSHYVAENMTITIVGNVEHPLSLIQKYFKTMKSLKAKSRLPVHEPLQKQRFFREVRKTHNSYIVLGYKTVPRLHEDSYVLDVIESVLSRGQSGWLFEEIRNKKGIAYQVGAYSDPETDYGYFAVYCGLIKAKIPQAKRIILELFRKLEKISEEDLKDAKTYLEGNHVLTTEDNFHAADNYAFWETIKDASLAKEYLNRIRKVSREDVRRAARKYFTKDYAFVSIEQKK